MDILKLLIVDDVEDNRLVLQAICRHIDGFEIKEAGDGIEAVEIADTWRPHIILMDIMMPRLDGFQASKIIMERCPETIIMAITAAVDAHMEEKMVSIGVAAYIHKPIDKNLIRFKLQNFAALIHSREGIFRKLSEKKVLNPFNLDVRYFKTVFEIVNADSMMDFGMWILTRCEAKKVMPCTRVDAAVAFFYELTREGILNKKNLEIVIEESFEEIYVTLELDGPILLTPKVAALMYEIGYECKMEENKASVRLHIHHASSESITIPKGSEIPAVMVPVAAVQPVMNPPATTQQSNAVTTYELEGEKEVRVFQSTEEQLLRQSFIHKTTAVDYVREIGGDVLDEIRDLESLDEEWKEKLHLLEEEPSVENIRVFTDGVLGIYVRAINNLFEFTALAYALSSLGSFLKENANTIVNEPENLKILVMLLGYLGSDLNTWRDHLFGLQDAEDIHYLDSSFFSSCMQIEGIFGNKDFGGADDDDGMEFF